jgi:hypothetical protein
MGLVYTYTTILSAKNMPVHVSDHTHGLITLEKCAFAHAILTWLAILVRPPNI